MLRVPTIDFPRAAMYEIGLSGKQFSELEFFPGGLGPLSRIDAIVVRVYALLPREATTLLRSGYLECKEGDKVVLESPLHTVTLPHGIFVPHAFVLRCPWLLEKPSIKAFWPESVAKAYSDNGTIRVEVYARE